MDCRCSRDDESNVSTILEQAARTLDFSRPVAAISLLTLYAIRDDDDPLAVPVCSNPGRGGRPSLHRGDVPASLRDCSLAAQTIAVAALPETEPG